MYDFSEEEHICTHLGDEYNRFFGAVVPPIFENSLFVFKGFEDIVEAFKDEKAYYLYTRGTNPTVEILEKKLAALEHGEDCKCFSSGMAAITASIDAFTGQGDHILFVNNIYGPALKYAGYLKKYGIEYTVVLVDERENILEKVEAAVKPNTKIIYLESPGTMTFKLVDLKAIADFAGTRRIITMIDNTWATPLYQKPLDMGIDISIHSCTKYIGGHSDVVAGALISSKEIINKIFYNEFQLHGGNIGPFEAWLLMRGLRTLPLRMQKHQENGMKIAEYLEQNKNVERVNYPGLKSNPYYELGIRQMRGYSGLMSFEIKSDKIDDIKKVVDSCRIFKIGVSWGGYESLILPVNHGDNEGELKRLGISPGLIRISVGLEDTNCLIEDLERALSGLNRA